ncbi:PREDICTED: ankyrin repeat and BTB/POZ domain-containing protein 1 [Propithecus coquereli]|uniref:ankyrin repeat and BTB/POZ domain-containing protein 1 n=1 Tax=Propithecus coquereli TaxID=379532 RepID=UPI00063F6ACF|nr:PREDICTED: ankyrin repeat and BTB/POZ domain-containing protein 1 [Propithecus coquereli]
MSPTRPPLPPPGARCEANTFDGERCLYGALSDAIRRALRDYKQVSAACRRRDYYDDFLQRLLEQGLHSDVVFLVHGKPFRAHRCVLGARSAYFANMLDTKWKRRSVVVLRHPLINPVAFGALLQYLYTGRLDVGVEHVGDCQRLAKQCQLWDLLGDLEAECEKVSEFVASKPGTCVKVVSIEPPPGDPRLREDMAALADRALPPELRGDLGQLPFPCPDGFGSRPDVCFRVAGCSFLCHKRLCGRSLAQLLDEDSVVRVWRVAKLFRLARLEDQCAEFMAKVVDKQSPWSRDIYPQAGPASCPTQMGALSPLCPPMPGGQSLSLLGAGPGLYPAARHPPCTLLLLTRSPPLRSALCLNCLPRSGVPVTCPHLGGAASLLAPSVGSCPRPRTSVTQPVTSSLPRYLLEQRDVEVNVRDKWDSTPLYYACLCGHEELVLYLLANVPGRVASASPASPRRHACVPTITATSVCNLPPEAACDVLAAADMFLLPGLKRLCGRSLAQLLDEDSVVRVWRVAKLFRLARLEDQCAEFMAKVVDKLVAREDFAEAVREEAAAVAARQETDSIPLVDDIRFHVAGTVQTRSAVEEARRRLRALEDLLASMGLDC